MALLLVSAAWAALLLFSTFAPYDDEGYMLLVARFLLGGERMYDVVPLPYGPAYLATRELIYGWLQIPLTHGATRLVSLACWLGLGGLCGMVAALAARSAWWGLAGFAAIVATMPVFANEPGHPQELIALMGALIPLIAWRDDVGSRHWFVGGAIAGVVLNLKFNAGVFCLAALAVVLVAGLGKGRSVRVVQALAVVVAATFPLVLMWPLLGEQHAVGYALICTGALTAFAVVVVSDDAPLATRWIDIVACVTGCVAVTVALLLYVGLRDSTLAGVIASILSYAGAAADYHYFRPYHAVQVAVAAAAPLLALILCRRRGTAVEGLLVIAKLYFVLVAATALLLRDQGNAHALLGWAGPWCWLCALPRTGAPAPLLRKLLAGVAATQLLLPYPIPGSQLYFGTFLVTVSALVCLADVAVAASRITGRFAAPAAALAPMLVLGLLVGLGFGAWSARQHYLGLQPLDLPGTAGMRLQAPRVRLYRELVSEMNRADVGFVVSGFNSLYFWSSAQPPAPVLVTHATSLLQPRDTRRIIAGLRTADAPLVVTKRPLAGAGLVQQTELADWIAAEFMPYRVLGRYTLLRRDGSAGKPPLAAPDWHSADEPGL